MGITCHFYSSVCLTEFFLGVIDLGNSELPNIVLEEHTGTEAEITVKAFLVKVLWLAAADRGARMQTVDNAFF